jgi:hypothetical protein
MRAGVSAKGIIEERQMMESGTWLLFHCGIKSFTETILERAISGLRTAATN